MEMSIRTQEVKSKEVKRLPIFIYKTMNEIVQEGRQGDSA